MKRWLPKQLSRWWIVYGLFGLTYFTYFWLHAIWIDKQGNLVAGHVNIWGDWAAHFTMTSRFAFQSMTDLASPFVVNARLSYPFMANWLGAGLVRLGLPIVTALVILSWAGSVAIWLALGWFYQTWFKSRGLAVLSALLFMCNGGLGFVWYLIDVFSAPQPWQVVLNPLHEYTRLDAQNLKWISVIDSMIVPQRAFTFGFPVAVGLLALVWHLEKAATKPGLTGSWRQQRFLRLGIGIGLGLLPIIHTHSFLAAAIILGGWLLATIPADRRLWKQWLWRWLIIAIPAGLLSAPLYFWFFASHTTHHFMSWLPGWLATDFHENWLWWWLKNWGLTPILAIMGSFIWINWPKKDWWRRAFWIAPFWLIFLLLNIIVFQPFAWDNTKLLVWASLGISGLAAFTLHHTWLRWSRPAAGLLGQGLKYLKLSVIGVLTIATLASGALDAYWVLRTDLHNYVMYSAEELQLAKWVKTNTPSSSRWLTGDQHNHWLFNLTGRQTLLAYRGWVWTHGYDYQGVERDVRAMLTQPATHQDLLSKYQVQFIVIGPNERVDWDADEDAWFRLATPVYRTPLYTILAVPQPKN